MNENVKWKVDGIFKADANECYREISSLEQITPKAILDFARDENSELHKCFEWDNPLNQMRTSMIGWGAASERME